MKTALLLLVVISCVYFTNALYLGENFLYRNRSMVMPSSFNVTLKVLYHVPTRLRLSSMCQVPQEQFDAFNNNTNGKYIVSNSKRGSSFPCPVTDTCKGWAVGGISDLCVGKKHEVVSSKCIENLWNSVDKRITDSEARNVEYTTNAVTNAVNGLNTTFTNMINGLEDVFESQLSATERSLSLAIDTSIARVSEALNRGLGQLASDTSKKMQQMQVSNNRKMATVTSALNENVRKITMDYTNRFTYLSSHLDNFVDSYNVNNMKVSQTQKNIMGSIEQLAVKAERAERHNTQGVDISPLLSRWQSVDHANVFQDLSVNNTYKYISTGMVGAYDVSDIDIIYPHQKHSTGKKIYKCYEEKPIVLETVQPMTEYTTNYNPYIFVKYAQGAVTLYDYHITLLSSTPECATVLPAFDDMVQNEISNMWCAVEGSGFQTCNIQDVTGLRITYTIYTSYGCPTCVSMECRSAISSRVANVALHQSGLYSSKAADDTGRHVYIVEDDTNYETTTSSSIDTWYYRRTGKETLSSIILPTSSSGDMSLSVDLKLDLYRTFKQGNNQFNIMHPTYGIMKIHRCEVVPSAQIVQYEGSDIFHLGNTDASSRLLDDTTSSRNLGTIEVDIYGTAATSAQILVRRNTDTKPLDNALVPDTFFYSKDIWCCKKINGNPVRSVPSGDLCTKLGYDICDSTRFGDCVRNGISNNVKLVFSGGVSVCPQGYSQTPTSTMLKYKSPRMYYCSGSYKFVEPYGVELTTCAKGEIQLPGAGVNLESGIMAPGGLFPASCIFWNEVSGKVPVYSITAEFEDQIVPTMLNDLHGKRIAFSYGDGTVIDEMDRLYGLQNSGYDCVSYEMDKVLHNPKSCINYDIPTYSLSAYFSGKVRSTGISRLLDYFDIKPIFVNETGGLVMNFQLKQGVDYESAYVDNVNNCPSLQVSYSTNGKSCILDGWSTTYKPGFIVNVANINVCDGRTSCVGSLTVDDGAELIVSIAENGTVTNCSRFICSSSTRTFIAYPTDTFSMLLQRPYQLDYIQNIGNSTELGGITKLLSELSEKLHNLSISNMDINTTIIANVSRIVIDDILEILHQNFTDIISDTQRNFDNIRSQLYTDVSDIINKTVSDKMEYLNKLYANNGTNGGPDFTQDKGRDSGFKIKLPTFLSISIVTLVLAIAALGLSLYMFFTRNNMAMLAK